MPLRALARAEARETLQTRLSRGRRSRNKVSVGEPAEGSLIIYASFLSLGAKN